MAEEPRERREREVIVTDGGGRSGAGTIIAAVLGIILVLIVGWFLLNVLGIMGDAADDVDGGGTTEVEVDAPDVTDDGGGGGAGDGGGEG